MNSASITLTTRRPIEPQNGYRQQGESGDVLDGTQRHLDHAARGFAAQDRDGVAVGGGEAEHQAAAWVVAASSRLDGGGLSQSTTTLAAAAASFR
jgi:hypothetical protein